MKLNINLFGVLSFILLCPIFPTLRIAKPLYSFEFTTWQDSGEELKELFVIFIIWYTMLILLWVITAIISAVTKSDSFINKCIISCGEKFTNKNVNKNNKNKYNLL
jgi:hypothetical protein